MAAYAFTMFDLSHARMVKCLGDPWVAVCFESFCCSSLLCARTQQRSCHHRKEGGELMANPFHISSSSLHLANRVCDRLSANRSPTASYLPQPNLPHIKRPKQNHDPGRAGICLFRRRRHCCRSLNRRHVCSRPTPMAILNPGQLRIGTGVMSPWHWMPCMI